MNRFSTFFKPLHHSCSPRRIPFGFFRYSDILIFLLLCTFTAGLAAQATDKSPDQKGTADQSPAKSQPKKPPQGEEPEPEIKGRAQISVDVALVNVDVTVRDKKGNLITGLQQPNFQIYEDGVVQQIKNFSAVEAPITVVLLIEFSRQVDWLIRDVLEAAYGFIGSLRKGDWCAIIGYDMRPTIITDFTQNKSELYDGMRRFNFPAFSESNLADALFDTLDRVEEMDRRVAVVLLSTGLDTFSKKTYQQAMDKAKNSNAPIYTLSMGQTLRIWLDARGYLSAEQRMDFLQSDNRLRTFAKLSGGLYFEPRFVTEYPSIFQTVSAFLRNQYSISYISSNTAKDGKYRKIKVEASADVDRDGKPDKLTLSFREGYVAPKS